MITIGKSLNIHDKWCNCLLRTLQTEECQALEEVEDITASQSMTLDQEMTLTQSDAPEQLSQEVIVIITDTESDEEQEEEDEEEEEQVESVFLRAKLH